MTAQQIRWAMQHSWYHNANGDVVYVVGDTALGEAPILAFNNFEALREWAGY